MEKLWRSMVAIRVQEIVGQIERCLIFPFERVVSFFIGVSLSDKGARN